jgi:hypothetical protein
MNRVSVIESFKVAVVTASVDYNPMQNLKKLEPELEERGYSGNVVFDLLTCNGLSENHFIQIVFNVSSFDRSTFVVLEKCDQRIESIQNKYFRANPELLSASVLSRSEVMAF